MKKTITVAAGILFVLGCVTTASAEGSSYQKKGIDAGSKYQKEVKTSYQSAQRYNKARVQNMLNKNCDGPQNKTRSSFDK